MLVGRLPFDHRLGRSLPIIVARRSLQRIEVDVLILQRMNELVHDRDSDVLVRGPLHHVQHSRVRIVVTKDLFGVEIQKELAHVHRLGDEAEDFVRRLLSGKLALRDRVA